MEPARRAFREEPRILLVLDPSTLAEVARLTHDHDALVTRGASSVDEATRLLMEWRPHIAVVDLELVGARFLERMGGGDGQGTHTPVIALTRLGDLKTKLAAFDQGADDVMTMPFSPEELLARVLAVSRRSYARPVSLQPVLALGTMELDILNRRVRIGDEELHLTGLEQSLLYLLAANAGLVITRDQIMDALWGADYAAGSNVVDQHVRSLRSKLRDDWRRPRFIATIPGKGYRFVPTVASRP